MSATAAPSRQDAYKFVAIGFVACSMLAHEILLTRICALRLFFNFGFLVISNCLLGIGASGTLLTLYVDKWKPRQRHYLGLFVVAYLASLVLTYVFLLSFPLPNDLDLGNFGHLLLLSTFSLAGAVPFFFGGTVVGMLLTFNPEEVNRLYAVDLLGAGLGCVACPALLPFVGAGGVFVVTAVLAVVAAAVVLHDRFGKAAIGAGAAGVMAGLALMPSLDRTFPVPSKGFVDFLRAIEAEQQGGITERYSVWTANSRIDLVKVPEGTPPGTVGRGRNEEGLPPHPEFRGISQDATAGTVVVNYSEHPEALPILSRSMYSLATTLRPNAKVFIIGLGGGNDVWATRANGARSIKAIELNWPIVEIHQRVMYDFSRAFVDDPKVELVVGEGRSALEREGDTYDVIQMTGVDTWTALASGAYVLAENYLYTREAIELMYSRLNDDGLIQITRFSETMEALRMMSNINAALSSFNVDDMEDRVLALSSPDKVMAIVIKKGVFTEYEQDAAIRFSERAGLGRAYVPKLDIPGHLSTFVRSQEKEALINGFPRNISPTTDDQPYFFNFTRWSDPLGSAEHADEIVSMSQGNPLFIISQLILSLLLSAGLILWPIARTQGIPKSGAGRYMTYFSALGLGFILIEIALMQKLTLFLGQPVYSLTVTLFSILVFTGLGSLLFAGRLGTSDPGVWAIPIGLAAGVGIFSLSSEFLAGPLIALPLYARITITVVLLAPIGLLLGVPFAYGLRVLGERSPRLLPWAWAINGCLSVIGSILTVVVSMNAGFTVVLWTAVAIYFVGFAALRSQITRSSAPATEPSTASGLRI